MKELYKKFLFLIKLIHAIIISTQTNEYTECPEDKVYNLSSGLYEAEEVTLFDRKVHKLIGIPYADTPRAFEKSQVKIVNDDVQLQKANKWSKLCIQPSLYTIQYYGNFHLPHEVEHSQDCLSINIYLPILANKTNNSCSRNERKLSAMLYLHGGSNTGGSGSYIDGSPLASFGDVIVATINYRLDVQGFFYIPGDETYKGNYALWDQLTALKWLHLNCPNLGCDPNSITLFGHSAGSADTFFHALSKHSEPYIKRIIMESGHGYSNWAFDFETEFHLSNNLYLRSIYNKNHQENDAFENLISMKTMKETLKNFLHVTTCRSTRKIKCLENSFKEFVEKYKFIDFRRLNRLKSINYSRMEKNAEFFNTTQQYNFIYNFFKMIKSINFDEFNYFLYYINSEIARLGKNSQFNNIFEKISSLKDFQLDKLLKSKKNLNFNHKQFMQSKKFKNEELTQNFDDFEEFNEPFESESSECLRVLKDYLNLTNKVKVNKICGFIDIYEEDPESFASLIFSLSIEKFTQCFNYKVNNSDNYTLSTKYLNEILGMDYKPIVNEMQICLNDASLNRFDLSKDQRQIDSKKTIDEFNLLTVDANNFHRVNFFDYDFFDKNALVQLNQQLTKFNKIDVMAGITRHEAFFYAEQINDLDSAIRNMFTSSFFLDETDSGINPLLTLKSDKVYTCLKKHILEFYGFGNYSEEDIKSFKFTKNFRMIDLATDLDFMLPLASQIVKRLQFEKNNGKILSNFYVYEFSHELAYNHFLKNIDMTPFRESVGQVIPHFSELDLVFGLPVLNKLNMMKNTDKEFQYKTTNEEYELSLLMMKYWSDFVKYGYLTIFILNNHLLNNILWTCTIYFATFRPSKRPLSSGYTVFP